MIQFELLHSNASSTKHVADSPNFSFFDMKATGNTNIPTAMDTQAIEADIEKINRMLAENSSVPHDII